jgi:KaiC/GvpD/RAD55 family RecA-like ATPase
VLKQANPMSRRLTLPVLLLAFAMLHVLTPGAFAASDQSVPVTLYAHAPPAGAVGKAPILNALPQWGTQQQAPIRQEAVFVLDPPIGRTVDVSGTWIIDLWLRAETRLSGSLSIYITENTADNRSTQIQPGINGTVVLGTVARDQPFGLFFNNITLSKGSTIQLHIKLSAQDKTAAYVVYDSATTQTQVTIPTRGATSAGVDLLTPDGHSAAVFETSGEARNASLVAKINITDAFGLYRLSVGAMQISNELGSVVMTAPDLLSAAHRADEHTAILNRTLNLPEGKYSLIITITDATGKSAPVSTEAFLVAVFYNVQIDLIDSINRPIEGAQIFASTQVPEKAPFLNYSATTNKTGWANFRMPSSNIVGSYQLAITWKCVTLQPSGAYSAYKNASFPLAVAAFDLTTKVKLLGLDLPGAGVNLSCGVENVDSGTTNSSGETTFLQVPPGNYAVQIQFPGISLKKDVSINQTTVITVPVPFPYQAQLPYAGGFAIVIAAVAIVIRRRRFYESPFDYMDVLTNGGLPDSCTSAIVGNSGSGKTVLMESLAYRSLKEGRGCVLVTNVELPSDTRNTMKTLGMDVSDFESQGKLVFIDGYSALSGSQSTEKRSLASLTDLTGLGIHITASIEQIGGVTDVYFDSLTPLFAALKPDYVVSFLQSIGAKVKSYNGRLYSTIGASLEKEAYTKVEEISDCVIETQLIESRSGQKRRLRIKKLRGHPYVDTWTKFQITGEKGITFLTRRPFDATKISNAKQTQ